MTALLEPFIEVLQKKVQKSEMKGFLGQAEIMFLTHVAGHEKFSMSVCL